MDAKNLRLGHFQGAEKIRQIEHIGSAAAKAVTPGVIAPGHVVSVDPSAAAVFVGKGAILRIQVSADTYVAFGDSTLAAVTSSTSPAAKLSAGWWYVNATEEFVRMSAAPSRLELIKDEG